MQAVGRHVHSSTCRPPACSLTAGSIRVSMGGHLLHERASMAIGVRQQCLDVAVLPLVWPCARDVCPTNVPDAVWDIVQRSKLGEGPRPGTPRAGDQLHMPLELPHLPARHRRCTSAVSAAVQTARRLSLAMQRALADMQLHVLLRG